MNITVYTCRFGCGHRQAARFLEQRLQEQNHQVTVCDVIEQAFPRLHRRIYSNFQSMMIKRNWRLELYLKADRNKSKVVPRLSLLRRRFFAHLDQSPMPDVFIATYSVVAQLLNEYIRLNRLNIPLITCITDFAPHEIWLNSDASLYLVASQACKDKLVSLGTAPDQVAVCGLAEPYELTEARPVLRTDRLKILVSGGGLGLLPQEIAFYRQLRDYFRADVRVVCGFNQKLQRKIEQAGLSHVESFAYVDDMRTMLQWADLFVGKPGGISTFEAILAETPIAFLTPHLPQEIRNARYILDSQIGFELDLPGRPQELFRAIDRFDRCRLNMRKEKDSLNPDALNDWLNHHTERLPAYAYGSDRGLCLNSVCSTY